jgi:hypothetical protein
MYCGLKYSSSYSSQFIFIELDYAVWRYNKVHIVRCKTPSASSSKNLDNTIPTTTPATSKIATNGSHVKMLTAKVIFFLPRLDKLFEQKDSDFGK